MMFKWRLLLIGLLLCFGSILTSAVRADDGIPDNCENAASAYYRPGVFARFELSNRRLVLVSWTTGEIVQVLASEVGEGVILSWSADCRYLAVALGTPASMDTVVYDTVDNFRVGSVPDAQGQTHHITWGAGNYLVVETRSGAILWNVPANTQQTLTSSFDTFTARNFSRLRWDAQNMLLIVNLAVGGRVVYDLRTGLETTIEPAVEITGSQPVISNLIVGDANYPCTQGFRAGYREWFFTSGSTIPRLALVYDITSQTIALYLTDQGRPYESLVMLEGNVNASWMQARGWSGNCQYVAASLGIPGQAASDTYVWDVTTEQRIGIYPDARDVVHPITWGVDSLVIETRDGAYLWHLGTNTRTLIQPVVMPITVSGQEGIRSFYSVRFSDDGSTVFTVNVDSGDRVNAFDARTAALLGQYRLEGATTNVTFTSSANSRTLVLYVYNGNRWYIVDRTTGASALLTSAETGNTQMHYLSPDGRFAAFVNWQGEVRVWDTTNLNRQSALYMITPEYRGGLASLTFTDSTTLAYSGSSYRHFTLNVTTGEFRGDRNTPPGINAVAETSGFSRPDYAYWYYPEDNPVCESDSYPSYDADANQIVLQQDDDLLLRVVVDNIPDITGVRASPGCRYLLAYSTPVTTEPAPYDNAPVDDASYDRFSDELVFYDVHTGTELLRVPHPYRYYANAQVAWSLDSNWAMIRVSTGNYLWDVVQNRLMPINAPTEVWYGEADQKVYWDFERGQMLISTEAGVLAFDLQTGEQRALYSCNIYSRRGYCSAYYFLSNFSLRNGTTLFVAFPYYGEIGVYDLDSGVSHQFYTGSAAVHLGERIAISPDGSLLAMARGFIRIWPESFEQPTGGNPARRPIYEFTGPTSIVTSIRFIDNTTVETISAEGVHQWNITTGRLVE
jgi:WD40 repeat protein